MQKDNTLCDRIYMTCPEKAKWHRQKLTADCLGLGMQAGTEPKQADRNTVRDGNATKLGCGDGCTTLYIY